MNKVISVSDLTISGKDLIRRCREKGDIRISLMLPGWQNVGGELSIYQSKSQAKRFFSDFTDLNFEIREALMMNDDRAPFHHYKLIVIFKALRSQG